MKNGFKTVTAMALGVAGALLFNGGIVMAQDRPERPPGNFDPQQMMQRMAERLRQQLDVKDDAEWKVISNRIAVVRDARRKLMEGFGGGGMGMGGPGGGGMMRPGGDSQGGGGPQFGGAGGFNRTPMPEMEALKKAVESQASAAELKAKLAQLKEARQKLQADLEKAQEDLRQVLSVRQEAVAATYGLL